MRYKLYKRSNSLNYKFLKQILISPSTGKCYKMALLCIRKFKLCLIFTTGLINHTLVISWIVNFLTAFFSRESCIIWINGLQLLLIFLKSTQ